MARPDLRVSNHGSVMLIEPVTKRGKAWCAEHVSREGFQPYWPTIVAEPRYVEALIDGAMADGLAVR